MNRIAIKIAASTAALSLTLVACQSHLSARPYAASLTRGEQRAQQFNDEAHRAIRQGNLPEAMAAMEQAVELSPRDAGYRLTLADIYMKSGRFESARSTFADVLELDPSNSRAGLSFALMQVALGRPAAAVAMLDELRGRAAPADLGLAYALAGYPERAIELLEPAAREPGATARVRQNLALSYAISGNWERARTIAAQDVSPADLAERMAQWASFARPDSGPTQVARLLGTSPVADPGQPVALALRAPAPAEEHMPPQAFAEAAAPEPEAVALPEEPVRFASAELPTVEPQGYWVPETPVAAQASAPEDVRAVLREAVSVPAPPPQPVVLASASNIVAEAAPEAAPVLSRPQPSVIRTSSEARAPRPYFERTRPAAASTGRAGNSRYVVQLGAFSNQGNAERAWLQAERRFGLTAHAPLTATIDHQGRVLHRVAIAGFASQNDAQSACASIKARGGACFVRTVAGDASVRWAARYAEGRTRTV